MVGDRGAGTTLVVIDSSFIFTANKGAHQANPNVSCDAWVVFVGVDSTLLLLGISIQGIFLGWKQSEYHDQRI